MRRKQPTGDECAASVYDAVAKVERYVNGPVKLIARFNKSSYSITVRDFSTGRTITARRGPYPGKKILIPRP